jgi:hypothetical protein
MPLHTTTNATLADDILIGAKAIATYLNIEVRQCFHWLENGYIPACKTGGIWTATRSGLRQHFSDAAVRESSARKAARGRDRLARGE